MLHEKLVNNCVSSGRSIWIVYAVIRTFLSSKLGLFHVKLYYLSYSSVLEQVQLSIAFFFQVEPLDYEEFVQHQRRARPFLQPGNFNTGSGSDPAQSLIDFPPDDIEVNIVPRKIRTLGHVLPEEPM